MNRNLLVPAGILLGLLIATAAVAAPATALFPEDTFLYVEADANALLDGLRGLDLARLLSNPEMRVCLKPALEKIGADLEKPVESLLARLPVKEWLDGRVAVGVRGVTVVLEGADGQKRTTRISPDHPVEAKLLHQVMGLAASHQLAREMGLDPQASVRISVVPDAVATVQPGPRLRAMVSQFLESPPAWLSIEKIGIAGRSVLRLHGEERMGPGVQFPYEILADISGDTWILGTDRDTFAAALAGGPERSLETSGDFQAVRKRLTAGGQVAFAYCDLARCFGMVSSAVSPLAMEEMEILGLSSFRGFGAAVSLADGGVRESFAFVMDGRPRGLFRLLDAMPTGLDTVRIAPATTGAMLAVKLDLSLFHQRLKELASEVLPGTEAHLDPMLQEASARIGVDLLGGLLPALGDEMSLIVFPPTASPIPPGILLVKVRDEKKFGELLALARERMSGMGPEIKDLPMTDGPAGFYVTAEGLPIQPAFAVRNGYLVGAASPQQLRPFLRSWQDAEPGKSLADDETYRKVLGALGAGSGERLAMLAFVNLRRSLPPVINLLQAFAGMAEGLDEWMDPALLPEAEVIGDHFSGLAIAVQRDGRALTLDLFSPTGMTPLAGAGAWFAIQARQRAQEEWMRQIEEMRRQAEPQPPAEQFGADEPFVGFNLDQAAPADGVHIVSVIPGTPAEKAGLQAEDVITALDETPIASYNEFRGAMLEHRPGDTVTLTVQRGEIKILFKMTLGRRGDFVR